MAGAVPRGSRAQTAFQTRERILAAARELFAEHGYAGTSIRMIARSLGITDPAVHYHFPSKQSLWSALLVEPDYGTLPLDRQPLSREALIDQVLAMFAWWTARPDLGVMLLREQIANDQQSIQFIRSSDETWDAAVTQPLMAYAGEDGRDTAALLFDMLAGVFWDAILTYGATFVETVEQEYFQGRVRAMIDLAIPGPRLAAP